MKKEEEIDLLDLNSIAKNSVLFSIFVSILKTIRNKFVFILLAFLVGGGIGYYINLQKKEIICAHLVIQSKYTNPQINLALLDNLKKLFPKSIAKINRVSNYDWFYDVYPNEEYPQTYQDWLQYQNVGTYSISFHDPSIHNQLLSKADSLLEEHSSVQNRIAEEKQLQKKKTMLVNASLDSIANLQIEETAKILATTTLKERLIELESENNKLKNVQLSHITEPSLNNKFSWKSVFLFGLIASLITLFVLTIFRLNI